ncbi:MAG: hypothetical protein Q8878_00870, partial [Bacillota bacterium]|nr:hypothetical protein [Bacillota bacterium]
MKRALRLTVFVLATLIFFAETALAADFTREAGYLLSLGVIRETNGGCALNRAPTRLEAAVLISRLLSGGGDLKKEAANSPFIDVPLWARPDIGFLYKKGVIKGASKSFFEPYADATPDMCLTLLLRALGYGE